VKRLLVSAAVLSLILTACGGGGGEPGGAKTPTGPVNITFWHSETASAKDNLVKLVDRLNASQNEVKVEAIFQGNDQDLALKLIASLRGSDVPTVSYMSKPYTQSS